MTWGHVAHIRNFWTATDISGTVEARKFKVGTKTHGSKFSQRKVQNWIKKGHVGVM